MFAESPTPVPAPLLSYVDISLTRSKSSTAGHMGILCHLYSSGVEKKHNPITWSYGAMIYTFKKEGFPTSGNPTAKVNPVLNLEQRRSFCVFKEIETLHFVSTFCMKGATKDWEALETEHVLFTHFVIYWYWKMQHSTWGEPLCILQYRELFLT